MKKPYEHILALVTGFAALAWFTGRSWLLAVAVLTGLSALLSPALARGIARLWLSLAALLGRVAPVVLLTAVFFLILLPLALLARLGGRDLLLLRKPANTAFRDREKEITPEDFEKTW